MEWNWLTFGNAVWVILFIVGAFLVVKFLVSAFKNWRANRHETEKHDEKVPEPKKHEEDHGHGGHGSSGDWWAFFGRLASFALTLLMLVIAGSIAYILLSAASTPRSIDTRVGGVAIAGPCDYLKRQTVFGTEKPSEPQNPGGSCGIDLFYDGPGGLYIQAAGSDIAEGPFYRGDEIPLDAEYIWSCSAPLKGAYKLVAARYK